MMAVAHSTEPSYNEKSYAAPVDGWEKNEMSPGHTDARLA